MVQKMKTNASKRKALSYEHSCKLEEQLIEDTRQRNYLGENFWAGGCYIIEIGQGERIEQKLHQNQES